MIKKKAASRTRLPSSYATPRKRHGMRATFAFAGVEGHASATRPMLFPILGAHVSVAEFMYPDKSWKETSGMLANFVADSGVGKGQLSSIVGLPIVL